MEGCAVYIGSEIEGWEGFGRRTGVTNKPLFEERTRWSIGSSNLDMRCAYVLYHGREFKQVYNTEDTVDQGISFYLYDRR